MTEIKQVCGFLGASNAFYETEDEAKLSLMERKLNELEQRISDTIYIALNRNGSYGYSYPPFKIKELLIEHGDLILMYSKQVTELNDSIIELRHKIKGVPVELYVPNGKKENMYQRLKSFLGL